MVNDLLKLCIKMQDYESENYGSSTKSHELFPELFNKDIFRSLLFLTDEKAKIVSAFIFDNILQFEVYSQNGIIEEYAPDVDFVLGIRKRKNFFAKEFGFNNFFEFYLTTRNFDNRIKDIAIKHLINTHKIYRELFTSIFGNINYIDKKTINKHYTNFLHTNFDNFSSENLFRSIDECLDVVLPKDFEFNVNINVVNDTEVTHNKMTISPRYCELNVALQNGFETYKSTYHAIGHALFPFLIKENHLLLNTDISNTESLAFLFQKICSEQSWLSYYNIKVNKDFCKIAYFYDIYFERLYCIKLLFDEQFYQEENTFERLCSYYENLSLTKMLIVQNLDFTMIDFKPNSAEFVLGYIKMNKLYKKIKFKNDYSKYILSLSDIIFKYY